MRQGRKTQKTARASLFAVVLAAGAVSSFGCAGKGAEGACGIAGDCGNGNPQALVGSYTLTQACQFSATNLYQPMNLTEQLQQPQNPSLAPLQPQPTTTGDWCSMLVYNAMGVQSVNLFHDAPQLVGGGTLKLDNTGGAQKYSVAVKFETPEETTHFSQTCLRYSGQSPSCKQLEDSLNAFYDRAAMQANPPNPRAFTGLTCKGAANGDGCDCSYVYQVILTDEGAWDADPSFIIQSSGTYRYNGIQVSSQAPTRQMVSTYCQDGNTLTMTGYLGATFEDALGVRSVQFMKN
jgi:hypothetical protein